MLSALINKLSNFYWVEENFFNYFFLFVAQSGHYTPNIGDINLNINRPRSPRVSFLE